MNLQMFGYLLDVDSTHSNNLKPMINPETHQVGLFWKARFNPQKPQTPKNSPGWVF